MVSMRAVSSTHRVIGPRCERPTIVDEGKFGTRPKEGLKPTTPLKLAGIRIDPPPSVPRWNRPKPKAAATPAPADDPPLVHDSFQGLRVMPVRGLSPAAFQANSC